MEQSRRNPASKISGSKVWQVREEEKIKGQQNESSKNKGDKGEQIGPARQDGCPLSTLQPVSRSIRLLAPYLSLEISLSGPWPKALGGRATSIPTQPLFLF